VLVAVGLAQRDACLLANHGVVAIGRDLAAALELAGEVEFLAEQYLKVLSLGPAHVLSKGQMAVVLEKFKDYGQR
jgi:L-fuculose-phosphate aldolase